MAVESTLIAHTLCTAAANYSITGTSLDGPNGAGQYLLVKYTGSGNAPGSASRQPTGVNPRMEKFGA